MENIITNVLKNDSLDEYPLFKKFCALKEKGLRKESFKALSSFIDETENWGNDKQQNFACWLFALFEVSENIHHLLVHPLEEKLLKRNGLRTIPGIQDHLGGMVCFYKPKNVLIS
jgi:hypothetical protein